MTVISATRILIAVCLFGVALAAKPGEAGYCQPGQTFKQDCNTCTCTDNGKNAICTLIACNAPPSPYRQKRDSPQRKLGEEGYCTPGQSFAHEDGCNTCTCSPDGKYAYCTLMGCVKLPESAVASKQKRDVPRGKPGEEGYCTPGESFKDEEDCNTCHCTADGKNAYCTEMACVKLPSADSKQKRNAPRGKPGEEGYCTPGESFRDAEDCNTCHCTADGKNAYCTQKACVKFPPVESKQKRDVPRGKPGEEGYCTPGETFRDEDDCNTCHCTADGKNAYCTYKACLKSLPVAPKQKRDTRQKKPGEEGYCTPGESFKDELDCNTCHCTDDGKNAICTEKICDKPQTPVNSKQKRDARVPNTPGFTCQPGSTFQYECNTCQCASDGKTAGCTFKACPPGSYRRRRQIAGKQQGDEGYCTPGQTFKDKCNTCKCSPDGRTAACTFALCPEGSYRRKRQAGNECQEGQSKQQECNTCHCANGHWICTLKACLKKRAIECQDGETKKDDCNTCRCVQGGWACTKIGCPPKQKRQAECSDGQTKQEDCNTCRCIQGGWACTRKFCPKAKRQAECSDGQTKQEDCNTCRCIQGGWACTRKFCPKTKREDPVETDFNGTSCAPNDKFNIDCNTCYCNNDGSGYSCTKNTCASATSAQT